MSGPSCWGSFSTMYQLLAEDDRPRPGRARPEATRHRTFADLGWTPRADERELVKELRGDIIRALGTLGRDEAIQAQAAEAFRELQTSDQTHRPQCSFQPWSPSHLHRGRGSL